MSEIKDFNNEFYKYEELRQDLMMKASFLIIAMQ